MSSITFAFSLFFLSLWQTEVVALNSQHFSAIRQLGEINGVALHCKALAETQRMKRALVLNLPKRRQLGELFDSETNASFLKFIREGAICPSPDELKNQVDEAIGILEEVFGDR